MRLLQGIVELLAPTRCAGCDLPGALLCEDCRAALTRLIASESCPRCGAPFGAIVCTECWEREFPFEAAISVGELARPLSRAVVLHKDGGERRLGPLLGGLIGRKVFEQWPDWPDVVTWIPPTPAALTKRGFDHGQALALPAAAAIDRPAAALLGRQAALDQRALGRTARALNAANTFCALSDTPPRVLVVDDVLTTGATLEAASAVLLQSGAREVRVAVVARAW